MQPWPPYDECYEFGNKSVCASQLFRGGTVNVLLLYFRMLVNLIWTKGKKTLILRERLTIVTPNKNKENNKENNSVVIPVDGDNDNDNNNSNHNNNNINNNNEHNGKNSENRHDENRHDENRHDGKDSSYSNQELEELLNQSKNELNQSKNELNQSKNENKALHEKYMNLLQEKTMKNNEKQ